MDSQLFSHSCGICDEIAACLARYSSLSRPQGIETHHISIYQEYLLKYISTLPRQCERCHHPEISSEIRKWLTCAEDIRQHNILRQETFYNLNRCAVNGLINEHLVKIRDALINDHPIGILNYYYVEKIIELDLPRCVNCQPCLDFILNFEIVVKLITKEITIQEAQIRVDFDEKARSTDYLYELANSLPKAEFHITGVYEKTEKKLVYMDSNIFMDLESTSEDSTIKCGKRYYDYYYSPSHLEDILKRELSDVPIAPILAVIENITDNLFIHRIDEKIRLVYEPPQLSYKRTSNKCSEQITRVLEDRYIKRQGSFDKRFPQFRTPRHKREINNKAFFGKDKALLEEVLRQIDAPFDLDDVKNLAIENISYSDLNDIVYKLLRAMDILHFWAKSLKSQSSVHDVEHLIYAMYSDIFVTNDKALYHRSKAILGHIAPNKQVMKSKEFQKTIPQNPSELPGTLS